MPSSSSSSPSSPEQPPYYYCYDSALDMAQAIRNGSVTSRQLVDMCIDRIERFDDGTTTSINAVVLRDFHSARRRADEADEKVRQWKDKKQGEQQQHHQQQEDDDDEQLGIFHGVPITIKEGTPTRGFQMTAGDRMLSYFMPSWLSNENARILVEEGGAILLGKTNCPLNQCDWETNNPLYGRTGNPYDTSRSPGGSSGGPAAALAAGLVPMELGSDIGGSIRIPAAMCGVVGHCATRGVLPSLHIQFGCGSCIDRLAAKLLDPMVWMARIGPMARNVPDVTAMLELLGGEVAQALVRPKEGSRLADYRIAVWRSHEICPPGREVTAAMDKAVAALKAAGAHVEELIKPPVDPMETYKVYLRFLGPFMWMHMPRQQKRNARQGRAKTDSFPSDIHSPFWEMHEAAVMGVPDGSKEECQDATDTWDGYLKKNFDVVLCPIFPCEAWPNMSEPRDMLADAKVLSRKLVVDGEERYYGDSLFWAHLSVLCGFPATGFPVCFSSQPEQLPVGLQAIGARGNDFIVLDVVQKLMQALGRGKFQPPRGFS